MTTMIMEEAMRARHTVRAYTNKPLTAETVEELNRRIAENNARHGLKVKLVLDDTSAFSAAMRLVLAKGVRNYLVLAGDRAPDLAERLGYASADLMLHAQTLGLNTWWVGGTFKRDAVSKIADGAEVIGIVAIGYGAVQGKPHKSKTAAQVSTYEGEAPDWFQRGVEAALLAPTGLNKQAFFLEGKGATVHLACGGNILADADRGLVKYHFELGAGKQNFEWAEDQA